MKKLTLVMALVAVSAFSASAQVPREIKGGILNGKAISLPKPEYPDTAKGAGIEGVVYVNVTIDEEGNVISAVADDQVRKVYKPGKDGQQIEEDQPVADALLRDAALRAAWNAKFSPTMLNRIPVKVSGTLVYNFVASSSSGVETSVPVTTSGTGRTSGGILNGRAASLPKPEYPAAAKAVRAQGPVTVQVTVDEAGNVVSAAAVSGHPLLRAAAVKAAKEAKFRQLDHMPAIRFTGVLVYNFVAPEEAEN